MPLYAFQTTSSAESHISILIYFLLSVIFILQVYGNNDKNQI